MGNPMLGQLNQSKMAGVLGNLKQIKNMVNGLQLLGSPDAALNYLVKQNPQMQQALDYVKQNGGDPKTAMNNLLKEQGIDPEQIMNALQ